MDLLDIRHISGKLRVNVCAAIGVVGGGVTAFLGPWQLAVLIGWDLMAATLVSWTWTEIAPSDAVHTRARATYEDTSRRVALLVMLIASVGSLVGMLFGLVKAKHAGPPMEPVMTSLAVLGVVLAWGVVHTVFAQRYAHQYYTAPVGGIDFPGGEDPDFRDFGYMAFTIGMSFAVSDNNVTNREIRRSVMFHALLSYLFGAVIVGLTINLMAGFVH
jgi:uncharacterized membrane protein